ncbi:prepilin peptidase [Caproiciproducens faecalis]|uniref:Prepilin peptidase n=1 Tax=Caproiciproducens faecalis TaxID=2820301 RepID=A0ABS7DKC2_9FIRM|nr:A24 family peptidase [Caproiciproducens faecalis]MBW7571551.1 prepilin peptidase [Caproiciproducens faecalis]
MSSLNLADAQRVYDFVVCLFCIPTAAVLANLSVGLFNALPARWFCDYDEQPGDDLYRKRLFFKPYGIRMTVVLSLSFIITYFQYKGNILYFYAFCAACVVLLMIAEADHKYFIIPDQFTLVLFVIFAAVSLYDLLSGSRLFHANWLSPLYGGAAGLVLLFLFAAVGRIVYRKEAMGFGDVKLFAAAGILTGFPDFFLVFFMTIFLAFFYILYLLLRKRFRRDLSIPLGPYLCLSLLLFMTFHCQIQSFIVWYMSLLNM